jgi:hypothetical protein
MKKILTMIVMILFPFTTLVLSASRTYYFADIKQCNNCINEMKNKKKYESAFTCITEKNTYYMSYSQPNTGEKVVEVKTADDKTEKIKLTAKSIKITESDIKALCPTTYSQIESGKTKK